MHYNYKLDEQAITNIIKRPIKPIEKVVHPYSSIDMTAAWKKLHFILSVRSDFHMIDSLSIAVHDFVSCVSVFFSWWDTAS